jgi:myo-inositol-1(or 4)-monophosphatase
MGDLTAHAVSPEDLEALERLAVEVAREAARLIVDERPAELTVARTKSSATDVVTVMDQRAQDLIRARLRTARPDDGFLGEEEGGGAATSPVTWVVDPIDGTVNYLYGIPAYAVSVAAVLGDPTVPGDWEPVAGAVVDPERGMVFHARRGGGAWRATGGEAPERLSLPASQPDNQPDNQPGAAGLGHALVGTGFGYEAPVRLWQSRVLLEVIEHVRDIRRIGSAALDLCHVADGGLDAYFERGLNPWDMAAGQLVVTEAGGVVGGLGGQPPSAQMVVAAAPALFAALEERVAAAVRSVGAGPPTS